MLPISPDKCSSSLQRYLQPPSYGSKPVPIRRHGDERAVVHARNGILLGHGKEGNLAICDSMGGPGGYDAK